MNNFDFHAPTRIVFGRGVHASCGEVLKDYASRVLLHYGGQSVKKSGVLDAVKSSLTANGIEFEELGGVVPNPRVSLVREGIKLCKEKKLEFILALGGGSVIDSAKAIGLGYYYGGDVWDIYGENYPDKKCLPVATILTIPAAGSEASPSSVITNEELKIKKGHTSQNTRPVVSFVNPELFATLPKNQAANGIADMMSHIFERYFTGTPRADLTDALCEATLRTIIKNAPYVINDPTDYDAWAEIGFCGTVAHIDLLGCGRVQDWACHGMEHELSAIYDVAHGAGLAVLTPGWMRYVWKDNVPMFVQFAGKIMNIDATVRNPELTINAAIDKLSEFFRSVGLPQTLSELGIDEKNLELMAKKSTGVAYGKQEAPLGGVTKLKWQDVLKIYESVK